MYPSETYRTIVRRELCTVVFTVLLFGTATAQPYAWDPVLDTPDDIAALASSGSEIWAVSELFGEVYRSVNGTQWNKISKLFMTTQRRVRCAEYSSRFGVLLVGTTDGIQYSTNAGASWHMASMSTQDPVTDIECNAGKGATLFASTLKGVILSTDGGMSWDDDGLTGLIINSLASADGYLHAGSIVGIYTRALSQTWASSTVSYSNHSTSALAVGDSGRMYASMQNAASGIIIYSSDRGASWKTGMYSTPSPPSPAPLVVSDEGRLFAYVPNTLYSWRQPAIGREETRLKNAIGSDDFDAHDMLIDAASGHGYICGWFTSSSSAMTGRVYRSAASTEETATQLRVQQHPQSTRSGWELSPMPRVSVHDAFGFPLNRSGVAITAMLSGGAAAAQLSGTTTRQTTAVGNAAFPGLSVDLVGSGYQLVFQSPGMQAAFTADFDIIPGGPAKLLFTDWPASGKEGEVLDEFVVELRDSADNLASNITSDLLLTKTPTTGTMTGTTSVPLQNGTARWDDIAVDTPGQYVFTAQYGSTITGSTPAISIVPAAKAVAMEFAEDIRTVRAGEVFQARVHLIDANGNRVMNDTREVRLRLGNISPPDTLRGVTTVKAQQGEALFDQLLLHRAGAGYVIIAEADGLPDAVSNSFAVTAGVPVRLSLMSTLQDVNVDEQFALEVEVLDRHGNRNEEYSQSVTLKLQGGGSGQLRGTLQKLVRGSAVFSGLSVDAEGDGYRIAASSTGLTSDTSNVFNVHPTEGSRLRFAVEPAGGDADSPLTTQPRIVVEDKNGRLVTVDGLNVTLTVLDQPAVTTTGGSNPAATSGGVADFSGLAIRRAGSRYRLLARAPGMISDTSAAFDITHGTAAQLLFRSQPGSAAVNTAIPTVVIAVEDQWQNTVTSLVHQISLSIEHDAGGGAILSGGTATGTVNGEARFDALSLSKPGSGYTLRATSPGLPNAVSSAFDITGPGAAFRLAFEVQPSGGPADQPLPQQPVVQVLDAEGRLVDGSNTAIELTVLNDLAALQGSALLPAVQGRATFNGLRITQPGSGYALIAQSNGLVPDTSVVFDITPGTPRFLTWLEEPSDVGVNEHIDPEIAVGVVDSEMNLVENSSIVITLGILDNPGQASLQGNTVRTITDGVARFEKISLNAPGTGYTLRALSPGFQELASRQFNVIGETELIMSMVSGDAQQGEIRSTLSAPLVLSVRYGSGAPAEGIQVEFSLDDPPGALGASIVPAMGVTDVNGRVQTVLTLGDKLGTYSVTAASGGVIGSPQQFTAQAVPPAYPTTVQLDHSWTFPYHEDRGTYTAYDYRIITLPGNPRFDITDLLTGAQNENWKLFIDDGSEGAPQDYLQPYDGGAHFEAETGRAFWLLHRGEVAVERSVPSAPVDAGRNAGIALHAGWNLIGNPFPQSLPWTVIQNVNGVTDPLYRFDDTRSTVSYLEPYFGYYYYNRDDRSELRIPWDSLFTTTRISADDRGWDVDISLEYAAMTDRTLSFGVHPEAGFAFEKHDWPSPRGLGGTVFAYFPIDGEQGARRYCGRDMRSASGERQHWTLTVESAVREAVTLMFSGVDGVPAGTALLLEDPLTGERLDLRRQTRYTIFTYGDPYRIHIFARPASEVSTAAPGPHDVLHLDAPYPNPAERGAVVALNLPHEGSVELTVRDVLGRVIRRLQAGTQPRGRSLHFWDGRDDAGRRVVAGPYFIHARGERSHASSPPVILLAP